MIARGSSRLEVVGGGNDPLYMLGAHDVGFASTGLDRHGGDGRTRFVAAYRGATGMTGCSIQVRAMWYPDAGVYIASSDDVPGLVAEAETPSALEEKLHTLIPELLELNQSLLPASHDAPTQAPHWKDIPVVITLEQA